jgi:hypothetical protein
LIRWVIPFYVAAAALIVAVVVVGAIKDGAAPGHEAPCFLHAGAALSGGAEFFRDRVAPGCSGLEVAEARAAVAWDFGFIAVYALVGSLTLYGLWHRAWWIGRVRSQRLAVALLPAATGLVDVVENVFVLRGLRSEGAALALSDFDARAAGIAGWWKWMLAALSIAAFVATVAAAIANLRTPQPPVDRPPPSIPPPLRNDTGIALSGGGIRSASFATGALRALDRRKVFRRARWVAAVSGGAYAAGAWFIGRGRTADAASVIPQPADGFDRLLDPPPGTPNLFKHIRANRRYLSTGRGGLAANVLGILLLVAFNVAALAVLVCLVAWPLGWFASTWLVQPDLRLFDYEGLAVQSLWVDDRLWLPGLGGLALAVLPAFASLFLWERGRRVALRIAALLAGGGVALLGLLVALPVALAEAPEALADLPLGGTSGGAGFLSVLTTLGITGAVVRLATKPLAKNALRLGGVLLALLAVLFGGKVATDAAYGTGLFAGSTRAYAALAAAVALFYALANAQTWSLFRMYYMRLRSTFATTQDRGRRAAGAPGGDGVYPLSLEAEPDWHEYAGREGPKLLVCAAVQRNGNAVTGVPALTFTFSDDAIGLRCPAWDATGTAVETVDHLVAPASYVERLRRPRRWGPRFGSVSAAVAMSGAAFTSAMGRQSLGTTNALLAALNVRLGVWMPNPRYGGGPRLKRPRLGYLLKEVFGVYDLDDPYVYVTDGGHWENLGLVELVRRRCKWIYCIDASGDAPDSFATLEEARTLARMECGAEIDIDLARLVKPERGLPERAVAVGLVRYHTCGGVGPDDCDVGVLFYGKAMLAQDAPINTLSFSLRDRIYPRYPTYDQFLAADEFDNLVRLGEWIGRSVALEYERLPQALAAGSSEGLRDTPALLEVYERLRGTYVPGKRTEDCRKCV